MRLSILILSHNRPYLFRRCLESVLKQLQDDIEVIVNNDTQDIEEIEHLHIDAQGADLAVLKGLGEKISIVKSGVIEVPQSEEVKLYKLQHSKEEAMEFLKANGFEITSIKPQQNEDNIFFERKK